MAYSEIYADTQKINFTPQGFTGYRKWRVSESDVDGFINWVSRLTYPGFSKMRCVSIEKEGLVGGTVKNGYTTYSQWMVTAHYSSAPWLDEPPQENIEFSLETFETGEGRTWKNTGTIMDSSMTVQNPTLTRTISFVVSSIPLSAILNAVGKVNIQPFQGFPAETLLFLGATTDTAYRWESQDFVYRVTYRFTWKRFGWNIVWRQPRQAVDDTGMPAFDDNGNPQFVEGEAGIGGFDRPEPQLYDTCYFEPLFGMPLPGSGGGGNRRITSASNEAIIPTTPTPNIPWLKTK